MLYQSIDPLAIPLDLLPPNSMTILVYSSSEDQLARIRRSHLVHQELSRVLAVYLRGLQVPYGYLALVSPLHPYGYMALVSPLHPDG